VKEKVTVRKVRNRKKCRSGGGESPGPPFDDKPSGGEKLEVPFPIEPYGVSLIVSSSWRDTEEEVERQGLSGP